MKNIFIFKKTCLTLFLVLGGYFNSQVRIANDSNNPAALNSSAFIDASSNTTFNQSANVGKGLLFPRTDLKGFTSFSGTPIGIANSYPNFYDGLIVYNTASSGVAGVGSTLGTLCRGFWYYDNPSTTINGGTWKPIHPNLCSVTPPAVLTLDCAGATPNGTLTQGVQVSGVSRDIPYTGGNGQSYPQGTGITSTGVFGLKATLQAGTLTNGSGSLKYNIEGTASSSGIASFPISFGGKSCDLKIQVTAPIIVDPVVTNLLCGQVTHTGDLIAGQAAQFGTVTTSIPYQGGNGLGYSGQTIPSTGVSGLHAILQPGTLANGNGAFLFVIVGTPSGAGTASFSFTFDNKTCIFTRLVQGIDPVVTGLNCPGATHIGTLTQGVAASGVNTQIPYTGGNGKPYPQGTPIASTGVAGLTAKLQAGILTNGNGGTLNYLIEGTPSSIGMATFTISFGGQSCQFSRQVTSLAPTATVICNPQTPQGVLTQGIAASGVFTVIGYTEGNGQAYPQGPEVTSTGVLGLKARLRAGTLNNGGGYLYYDIYGTPTSSGNATFTVSFAGQQCVITRLVKAGDAVAMCGSSKLWKRTNLGADAGVNPDIPAAGIHGAKYQWGTFNPALTQAADQQNSGTVPGWNTSPIPNNAWNSTKTANDPCPSGYRVPTSGEWNVLLQNNAVSRIGTFSFSPTNYTSAMVLTCSSTGNKLTLPTAGFRYSPTGSGAIGELVGRGSTGHYWSSTMSSNSAIDMYFTSSSVVPTATNVSGRNSGLSVRCISQ